MITPFFRVDNRLLHGQIIATWLPYLRTKHVLVVSDQVPENALQISMFEMIVPSGTSFTALPVATAGPWLVNKRAGREPVLVLFETVEDAVRLFATHAFTDLNIGNVHHGEDTRCFTHAVYLTKPQIEQLQGLMRKGVHVEVRSLPDETPIDLRRACKEG